jgi:hypothetical protein
MPARRHWRFLFVCLIGGNRHLVFGSGSLGNPAMNLTVTCKATKKTQTVDFSFFFFVFRSASLPSPFLDLLLSL